MKKIEFRLSGEYVELNNLLKLNGLCDSGGSGKMLVASGEVFVDGKAELRKSRKIRSGQTVAFQDTEISVLA